MDHLKSSLAVYFHVHLVSDSTGETLSAVMKASAAQFSNATALEHLHTLIRSESQMDRALNDIAAKPGVVFYTLVNPVRRTQLETRCADLGIPAVSILDPTLATLGRYLGVAMSSEIGAQRNMDADYFKRIGSIDFAMAHDDGQHTEGLKNADIILVGISRTSKTPTCIYLANRGLRAGNIPMVPGVPLPPELFEFKRPLIVGLVASPDRIVQIRQQRLMTLNERDQTDYIDAERVREEMLQAKRLFVKNGWPFVDVTRRSVEETSARILNMYQDFKSGANL